MTHYRILLETKRIKELIPSKNSSIIHEGTRISYTYHIQIKRWYGWSTLYKEYNLDNALRQYNNLILIDTPDITHKVLYSNERPPQ